MHPSLITAVGMRAIYSSRQSPSAQDQVERDPSEGSECGQETIPEQQNPLQQRRRHKRMAIEVPPETISALDKDELKRWKNRVAAARSRERVQRQVQELQITIDGLRRQSREQTATIAHLREIIHSLDPSHIAGLPGASTMSNDALAMSGGSVQIAEPDSRSMTVTSAGNGEDPIHHLTDDDEPVTGPPEHLLHDLTWMDHSDAF